MNNWNGIGRLTKDVEITTTSAGKNIGKVSIAIPRRFKDGNGKRETDFFDLVAFGKTAEFMKNYFHGGSMIGISGRLQQERWSSPEGQNRSKVSIIVENAYFTGNKDDSEHPAQVNESTQAQAQTSMTADFMDIPDGLAFETPFN